MVALSVETKIYRNYGEHTFSRCANKSKLQIDSKWSLKLATVARGCCLNRKTTSGTYFLHAHPQNLTVFTVKYHKLAGFQHGKELIHICCTDAGGHFKNAAKSADILNRNVSTMVESLEAINSLKVKMQFYTNFNSLTLTHTPCTRI